MAHKCFHTKPCVFAAPHVGNALSRNDLGVPKFSYVIFICWHLMNKTGCFFCSRGESEESVVSMEDSTLTPEDVACIPASQLENHSQTVPGKDGVFSSDCMKDGGLAAF